jgi:CRISPR/Cas system endoribonuclease Cas6 (RAMP superfamily)
MASAMMPFLLGLSAARGIVGGIVFSVAASRRKVAEG